LADRDTNSGLTGVVEHIKAAVGHAFEALRCTASVLTADAERRAQHLVETALWMLAWVAVGVVGVVMVAVGLSEILESALGLQTPGAARLIAGAALLAAFFVGLLVRRLRKGQA